jgi:hypothetical protein
LLDYSNTVFFKMQYLFSKKLRKFL